MVGDPADGYGTIFYTKDGGQHWNRQADSLTVPNTSLLGVQDVDKYNVWIVGDMANGYATILRTTNGGLTWHRIDNYQGVLDNELLGFYTVNSEEVWAVGINNTIIHTIDG
ncbi:MAG: hypothetical protein SVM86_06670 [Candidatus Cloacimonadota bacterium]|nr:hypothetical protein [Candidatus Cloacimonadota bacterium]